MSDTERPPVDPGPRGTLTLFSVSLDAAALGALSNPAHDQDPDRPFVTAAPALLGAPGLDLRHVELFDTADLAGLGLPAYIATAHDIPEEQIAPHRARLAALDGFVLLLLAEGLPAPGPLHSDPALTEIARFDTPRADVSMKRLPSETARGTVPPPVSAPAASDGRRAPRGALIVLGLALAVLLLWAGAALLG